MKSVAPLHVWPEASAQVIESFITARLPSRYRPLIETCQRLSLPGTWNSTVRALADCPAGAAGADAGGVGGVGAFTAKTIVTRRLSARPAGLSDPSGLVLGATGSADPRPLAWNVTPGRAGRRSATTAAARACERGMFTWSVPIESV